MPNLKDLKIRIDSVKSTQKITSAMKMVAAAKLRKAQMSAESARPYAERMEAMVGALAKSFDGVEGAPELLAGNGKDEKHLIVLVASDRGLCGGFNAGIGRFTRNKIAELQDAGKSVKVLCIGRKGRDQVRRQFGDVILDTMEDVTKNGAIYSDADDIALRIRTMYEEGEIDVCTVVYNKFISAITQEVTPLQVIPFAVEETETAEEENQDDELKALYEYEPSEEDILEDLLPRNLSVQIFRSMLESYASEQGSRMAAMDNATRNAGEMIDGLTLTYNRARQAAITSELIEIISGAEAL
ncbi:ATP synthase gamma chain [Candidatus Terasakiella magnetica]|uniref:ATP synthase gamma chain n=1 Tax=Candidatus Terasakiella magnetica TaxID=1867952 RepID=A0A1C3RKH6_9PROT|nr:F0F1 ATP synthase subunit gamma [Candidatus Terasakiella magnetica]SCA57748.1 ATP synthase gamma chain [Candidatus Terasakiella magnetica]